MTGACYSEITFGFASSKMGTLNGCSVLLKSGDRNPRRASSLDLCPGLVIAPGYTWHVTYTGCCLKLFVSEKTCFLHEGFLLEILTPKAQVNPGWAHQTQ